MSQTLRNRIGLPEWYDFIKNDIDLVIIDEAHVQEFNYLFNNDLLITSGGGASPLRRMLCGCPAQFPYPVSERGRFTARSDRVSMLTTVKLAVTFAGVRNISTI